jgi:hypothetical protein
MWCGKGQLMKTTAKLATLTARRAALIALAAGLYGLANLPARAADEFYAFKSVVSSPNASWCIEVPGGEYQTGKHVLISECGGKPNQIFGYEEGGTLTAGGYCLDGLAAAANATSSAGHNSQA